MESVTFCDFSFESKVIYLLKLLNLASQVHSLCT